MTSIMTLMRVLEDREQTPEIRMEAARRILPRIQQEISRLQERRDQDGNR